MRIIHSRPKAAWRNYCLLPMALALLCLSFYTNGQELFRQDFESSTTLSSYVNATNPSSGQFTFIGAYLSGDISRRIENGALTFEKTTSSTGYGVFVRNVDFAGPPQTLVYGVDVNISAAANGSSGALVFGIGNGFANSASNPSTSAFYLRTAIRADSAGGFTVGGQSFKGVQRLTFYLNNSGASANYISPSGTSEALANDKFDLWVGSLKVIAAGSVTTAGQSISELHFKFGPSVPVTASLDNIVITTFDGASPDIEAPTTPSGLSVSGATQTSLELTWSASADNTGVAGYNVFVNGVEAGEVSGTTYTFNGLTPGTSYELGVNAVDAAGNTSATATINASTLEDVADTEVPSQPSTLQATASVTSVLLNWLASGDNVAVSGYKIYRDGTLIDTTTNLSYESAGLAQATTYTFGVSAFDASGNESSRATVTVTTNTADTTPPTAVTNLQGTPTSSAVQLSWDASQDDRGVVKYRVYKNGVPEGETSGITFQVYGLSASTTYSFGVQPLDEAGNESSIITVSVTTLSNTAAGRGLDSFYGLHLGTDTDVNKSLKSLSDMGIYWTRIWLDIKNWADPTKDNHSGTVSRALALHNAGYKVCLNLNANAGVVPESYEQAKAYFEYLFNIPGLKDAVDMWEIHNELNLFNDYWKGTPEEYVNRSLKAGWDVFHPAGEWVLGGSFTLGQGTFGGTDVTEAYVNAGYLNYCDFAGTHPYATSFSELKTHVNKILELYGNKPVFISEWNYKSPSAASANSTTWANNIELAMDYFYNTPQITGVCYYRLLDGGDKVYWPGVIFSGTYKPVLPYYNMYKSFPKTPDRNNAAPQISIIEPAATDTIVAGETVRIQVSASDSDGTVLKVAFYYDGDQLIGEDTDGSDGWSVDFTNIPAGRYEISALATDNGGATRGDYGPYVYAVANTTGKVIGINFIGTGSSLAATDSAGVVVRRFWNNAVASATTSDLLDENGENSGASVSTSLSSNYRTADAGSTGDFKLMRGYVATFDGSTKEVNVNNLPPVLANSSYDVYVYWGNQDGDDDYARYTLNGTSYIIRDNTNRWNGVHTLSNAQTAEASATGSNFVVFRGVTGGSFKLQVRAFGTYRAGVSGIQIVSSSLSPQLGIVNVTSPASGSVFKDKETVSLSATTDSFGTLVKSVSFYAAGSQLIGTDTSAADGWNFDWISVPAGIYSVTAVGKTAEGLAVLSAPVSINVLGEAGDVISVSFKGQGPELASSEVAGKVPAQNWNNSDYNTTTLLVDADGNNTGATVSNTLPSAYRSGDGTSSSDAKMMRGFIANFSSGTKEISVKNLPENFANSVYDVYLYASNLNNTNVSLGFELAGTSYFVRDNTATWDGSHDRATATTQTAAVTGPNYVLFEGITGKEFRVKVSSFITGSGRIGVSGMQIVRSKRASSSIFYPSTGEVYAEGDTVTLRASISNFTDSIPATKVSFYYDEDQLIGEDTDGTNGWSYTWTIPQARSYSIISVASAEDGTAGKSLPINIRAKSAKAENVISVNFKGLGSLMNATDTAGAVPVTFWNNSNGNDSTAMLVNAAGDTTSAYVKNNIPSSYASFDAQINGDYKMMKGYIANFNGDEKTLTVGNLPEVFTRNGYHVIAYWGNKDTDNDVVSYTLDSTTYYLRDGDEKWDGLHTRSKGTAQGSVKGGANYVLFDDLSASTFTIRIKSFNTFRGGISGLQIIAKSPSDTIPPVVVVPSDITVSNDSSLCSALVNPGTAEASDESGVASLVSFRSDSLALDAPYPVGTTQVIWVATDNEGNIASASQNITVIDDESPVVAVDNISTVNIPGQCEANIDIIAPSAFDNCGLASVSATRSDSLDLTSPYPVGETTIFWSATDVHGNTTTVAQVITVADTEAPSIQLVSASTVLWPPNHKYHEFSVASLVSSVNDNCSSLSNEQVKITSVTSDEADQGPGNFNDDVIITPGCASVRLRAERLMPGNGRVYTITLSVKDAFGNESTAIHKVSVPVNPEKEAVEGDIVYTVSAECNSNGEVQSAETEFGIDWVVTYPNPVKDYLLVKLSPVDHQEAEITITDFFGITAKNKREQVDVGISEIEVNVADLAEGIYLVRVKLGDSVALKRIVIDR